MVQLSEQAAVELQALKNARGMQPSQGIKLVPQEDRLDAMDVIVAEPAEGDEVIRRNEDPLLIIDSRLTEPLRDLTFDYEEVEVDGQVEQRFRLRAA